jgi:hypothetical protein
MISGMKAENQKEYKEQGQGCSSEEKSLLS